ncbi:hypothetical protein [Candidatus Poriferisodalis sp.]|uniref:hypothetical protein n=1 Tax=Candidatus Poriferisodalis sp. TaxID=3101277 RepID=UPI003B5B03AF
MAAAAVRKPLAGPPHSALDDLLDAAAAAWTARQFVAGHAAHIGTAAGHVRIDDAGYPMTIVV